MVMLDKAFPHPNATIWKPHKKASSSISRWSHLLPSQLRISFPHFIHFYSKHTMNRQPNDRDLNSNTNPSSVDSSKVEEPNLKIDSVISSFHATIQASVSSRLGASSSMVDNNSSLSSSSFNSFNDSLGGHSSINMNVDQRELVRRRNDMTEQYLFKALNLDRR